MKEFKDHIRLANLMAKDFAGELEPKDKAKLDAFTSNQEQNDLVIKVRENLLKQDHVKRYSQFDLDAARRKLEWKIKFKKKSKMRRFYNAVRLAAVLALPIAITTYMVATFLKLNESQYVQGAVEIVPGSTKAQLYLSDGREVDLENADEYQIAEVNGSVILKDSLGLNYQSQSDEFNSKIVPENIIVTPVGGEYQVILSDGTKVWMNAKSELRYPVKFTGETRKVSVVGEVYFEVTKDKERPFFVEAGGVEIKVLGTKFNVMAYKDEDRIETTLVEGAVELKGKGYDNMAIKRILKPGDKANYILANRNIEVSKVSTDLYTAWINGKFVFEKENLGSIMRKLERWYNVKVFYQSQDLRDYLFSARIDRYGNIEGVLKKMELTTNVRFNINDGTVLVCKY